MPILIKKAISLYRRINTKDCRPQ